MKEIQTSTRQSPPLLRLEGLQKSFPGVQALQSASFELLPGEIHALVGENGAGKSTLIKILTGVHTADGGQVYLKGHQVTFHNPQHAQAAGIAAIYQEFALFPALTVRENLFMGREKVRRGILDFRAEQRQAEAVFRQLGVDFYVLAKVGDLNVAQQQLVEIARALTAEAEILVMDEPTAALAPQEVERLFAILRDLTQRGIGIIFISHRLDEVLSLADRLTVLRDGKTLGTWKKGELDKQQLIEQMMGRALDQEFPKVKVPFGEVCLEVRGLSGGKVHDVSFTVRRGEVLGIAGLMGAGRTEVARLLFGADVRTQGEILLNGRRVEIRHPGEAIQQGICLLTEDRKGQGLVLKLSAQENFALGNLAAWSRAGWINRKTEQSRFLHHVQALNIRLSGPDQLAVHLSGGNQQKLLVARWLERQSQVVIFDEPTRGIDVGAKYEMYLLINDLAAQGKAIILISSELPEILGMCDRVLVLKGGRLAGEIPATQRATQDDVMRLAV